MIDKVNEVFEKIDVIDVVIVEIENIVFEYDKVFVNIVEVIKVVRDEVVVFIVKESEVCVEGDVVNVK